MVLSTSQRIVILVVTLYVFHQCNSLKWSVSPTRLEYQTYGAFAAIYNDFVYIIGGRMVFLNPSPQISSHETHIHPIYKFKFESISNNNSWQELPNTENGLGSKIYQSVLIDNYVFFSDFSRGFYIFDLMNEQYVNESEYSHNMPLFVNIDNCLCKMNHKIYVIGGRYGTNAINSTQIYDIINDEWIFLLQNDLNIARMNHGCVYSSVDHNIYVFNGAIGDLNDYFYTNTIEIYNDINKKWILLDIAFDIGMQGMFVIEYHNYIYLIGGQYGEFPNYLYTDSIRKYNVSTKNAVIDSYLILNVIYSSVLIYNDKIYAFGGYPRTDIIQIAEFDAISDDNNNILPNINDTKVPLTTMYTTTTTTTTTTTNPKYRETENENTPKSKSKAWVWGLVTAIVLIFGIWGMYYSYQKYRRNQINNMNDNRNNNIEMYDEYFTSIKYNVSTNNNCENDTYIIDKVDTELEELGKGSTGNVVGNDCVICMEPFIKNQEIVKIHCGHLFHRLCAINWIKENPTCPLCRVKCQKLRLT